MRPLEVGPLVLVHLHGHELDVGPLEGRCLEHAREHVRAECGVLDAYASAPQVVEPVDPITGEHDVGAVGEVQHGDDPDGQPGLPHRQHLVERECRDRDRVVAERPQHLGRRGVLDEAYAFAVQPQVAREIERLVARPDVRAHEERRRWAPPRCASRPTVYSAEPSATTPSRTEIHLLVSRSTASRFNMSAAHSAGVAGVSQTAPRTGSLRRGSRRGPAVERQDGAQYNREQEMDRTAILSGFPGKAAIGNGRPHWLSVALVLIAPSVACSTPALEAEVQPDRVQLAPRYPQEKAWPLAPDFVDQEEWIRLTSGEWLKGEFTSLRRDSVEFDSDELDELTLDWEDVAEVITTRPFTVVKADRSVWSGPCTSVTGRYPCAPQTAWRRFRAAT